MDLVGRKADFLPANTKEADQTANSQSMISILGSRSLESTKSKLARCKIVLI